MTDSPLKSRSISRTVAGALLLAALVFYGLRPWYVQFLVVDAGPWQAMLGRFPDRHFEGYREFVLEARRHTPPGSSIAILFPTLSWDQGYSYAYFRGDYLLAGRRAIPLAMPEGPRLSRLADAEYVASWRAARPAGDWTVVWQGSGGELLRRAR